MKIQKVLNLLIFYHIINKKFRSIFHECILPRVFILSAFPEFLIDYFGVKL